MAPLFGPSPRDVEHLRTTLRALGTASVPGLSVALSWREHKTERLLAVELARPGTPIVYDPARRTVRWVSGTVAPPSPSDPPTAATSASPVPHVPGPVYTPEGLKTLCPTCRVALQSTGSGALVVCPKCGRLSSRRGTPVTPLAAGPGRVPPPPLPTPTVTVGPGAAPVIATSTLADRRSQELFAAWVTNQPIPCPKCRTTLRHRGVGEYYCPACAQQVRFESPKAVGPAPPASAPPPPMPVAPPPAA